ncbi:MAG TPA: stage II sporulation protein P [Syntrophomonadaceae bacterium]|nr:stage II sporulation protein P [Syntrophomonadaceae bacterium]
MLVRFKERQLPARGLAVFFGLCLCLLGFWGMVEIHRTLLLKIVSYPDLLEWGLGGRGGEWEEHSLLGGALICLTGVDARYLPGILEAGLPAAAFGGATTTTFAGGRTWEMVEQSLSQQVVAENEPAGCEVAIYHTHNAETYIPLNGRSKVDGKNGGVSLVGEEMVKVLGEAGIRAVHDLTVHDYPDFPTSYIKSEVTARKLVQENPELKVLIDLHRDAGLPKKETARVGGEDVARILLVVGTGERLANPHWRENYAFAQSIAHRLEERYPGVLKAVRLKAGRYNQHISPHAVLVEVGSDKNTLAEGLGAARCLAHVLVELLEESKTGGES